MISITMSSFEIFMVIAGLICVAAPFAWTVAFLYREAVEERSLSNALEADYQRLHERCEEVEADRNYLEHSHEDLMRRYEYLGAVHTADRNALTQPSCN